VSAEKRLKGVRIAQAELLQQIEFLAQHAARSNAHPLAFLSTLTCANHKGYTPSKLVAEDSITATGRPRPQSQDTEIKRFPGFLPPLTGNSRAL